MRKIRYQVACRSTFEVAGAESPPGMKTFVFSRPLRPEDHPGVTIVSERVKETLDDLRAHVYEKSGIVLLKYDVVSEENQAKSRKRKAGGRRQG